MNADVKVESEIAEHPPRVEGPKKYLWGTMVIGTLKAVGLDYYHPGKISHKKRICHEVTVEIKYDFDKKDIVCGSCKGICDHAMTFRVLMGEKLEDILIKAVFKKGEEQFKKGKERP